MRHLLLFTVVCAIFATVFVGGSIMFRSATPQKESKVTSYSIDSPEGHAMHLQMMQMQQQMQMKEALNSKSN